MPIIQKGTDSPFMTEDYVTLNKVLEWRESKSRRIPKKRIPNKESFYSEPDCAVESPKRISLVARVNSTEKAKLIEYLDGRRWHELYEGEILVELANIDCIWIETLDFDYRITEHVNKPWMVSIGLICKSCVSPILERIGEEGLDDAYFKVKGEVWFNREAGGYLGYDCYFPTLRGLQGGGYFRAAGA